MTINQLIKKLQDIKKQYPNRRLRVYCDTQEAKAKLNDVFEIVEIDEVRIRSIEMGDGDGFLTGKSSISLVLS